MGENNDATYHNEDQSLSVIVQLPGELREAFKMHWVISEVLPLIHIINISMLHVLKEITKSTI